MSPFILSQAQRLRKLKSHWTNAYNFHFIYLVEKLEEKQEWVSLIGNTTALLTFYTLSWKSLVTLSLLVEQQTLLLEEISACVPPSADKNDQSSNSFYVVFTIS